MGRGWTILEAGNRGNVLMRSVGAQVYGDLSEWVVVSGNCAGEEYERDEAPAGKSGAAMNTSALSIEGHVAYLSRRDNGRWRRVRWIDGRRGNLQREICSHGEIGGNGGPRMCCARAKVAMTSMGAPQCRHTNVGRTEPVAAGTTARLAATTGAG
jgi:hypothetical protein